MHNAVIKCNVAFLLLWISPKFLFFVSMVSIGVCHTPSGGSPGNYRISNHASNSTLRMRDVLKDPSILQSCVLGPRNFIQLLWSFLGSLFIL